MVGVAPRLAPAELARTLAALPVHVQRAHVMQTAVPLPDYPGEPRPSSTVELHGAGLTGYGENVAFYGAEHAAFAEHVTAWFGGLGTNDSLTVESALAGSSLPRYERAALEAALIDLALRQAELSLYDLAGVPEAELRFVASLNGGADPIRAIARMREAGFSGQLKLDLDEHWTDHILTELGHDPSIVILDFKGRGNPEFARRVAHAAPHALLEDPPEGAEIAAFRVSRDAPLASAAEVLAVIRAGSTVNLKAPRMAGPLEVLRALELAGERAYLGGMFEVGVGRHQARLFAALYCPSAPNDLALNRSTLGTARSFENVPALIDLGCLGLNADGR